MTDFSPRLSPSLRTIPGSFHIDNFGSVDIGWHGLLACGNHNMVMVVDLLTVQLIQSFEVHKSNVIKVKWSQDFQQYDSVKHKCCKLAAADSQGKIAIWDVSEATQTSEFGEGTKSLVRDLQWIHYENSATELLLALHAPGELVLWNGITGIKLWSKSYNDLLLSFTIDPFDSSNIIFRGRHSLLMIKDFSVSKMPPSNGKRFHISNSNTASGPSEVPTKKTRSSQILKATTKLMTGEFLLSGLSEKSGDLPRSTSADSISSFTTPECMQISFHGHLRNHLIVVYPREVLIIDLLMYQTVSSFSTEKNSSCFVQVYSCRQRNIIYSLHENGAFSIRYGYFNKECGVWTYDIVCQGESMRLSRQIKLIGMAVNPATERSLALVTSDSHIQAWSTQIHKSHNDSKLRMMSSQLSISLADCLYPDLSFYEDTCAKQGDSCQLKLIITGLWSGNTIVPTIIRMCPPLTKSNLSYYQPLLAVANNRGSVQIWDLETGQLWKEYAILTCPIHGLEWTGLNGLVANGFLIPSSSVVGQAPKVKNEMVFLDLSSGHITPFRNVSDSETPIEFIRVSYLKQYLAIGFRDKAVEIWDIRTLLPMKEFPTTSPRIITMEWLPQRSQKKVQSSGEENSSSEKSFSQGNEKDGQAKSHVKESMVATDTDGLIYLYSVEGTFITEATKVSRDTGLSKVSAVIWKNDRLVIGDVESNIIFWNLREKSPRGIPSQKGPVRKMKFAPGSGNFKMFVLYHDTIDIWDAKTVKLVSNKSLLPTVPHLIDADWVTSDKPVICTADGCLKIMDMDLKTAFSVVEDENLCDPLVCFSLLPSKVSSTLHYLLQHYPTNESENCDPKVCPNLGEGFEKVAINVTKILGNLSPLVHSLLQNAENNIERCYLVSELFGNEYEMRFWNIVRCSVKNGFDGCQLDCLYDILADPSIYKSFQDTRLKVLEKKRCTYWQTQRCATALLMTGHSDRAVKLLLETPPSSENYLLDMHKACLVSNTSAQKSSVSSESTLKLVATDLISNNNLWDGVQLLCMIEKYADACRYLESFGEWNTAVWLAKCTLSSKEAAEVFLRWSAYLATPQVNQKSKSVLILLSLGEHQKVLETLYGMRQFQLATRYLEICEEFELLDLSKIISLSNAIFLEYARHLMTLGNKDAAIYYCDRAGEKGQLLKQEVEFILSD